MVGGGEGAFIGGVHRIALRLDGHYELVAGCFSSDFNNSKDTGRKLGLSKERIYETYQEMAEKESCLLYTSPSPRDPKTSRMPSSA